VLDAETPGLHGGLLIEDVERVQIRREQAVRSPGRIRQRGVLYVNPDFSSKPRRASAV
jgi:hypothetical protein